MTLTIDPNLVKGLAQDGQKFAPGALLAHQEALRVAVEQAITDGIELATKGDVTKSISPFFMQALAGGEVGDLTKDFSAAAPTSSYAPATGFVPFDLSAPAKLTYPVFSPLRNRIPRTRGQGNARIAKRVTGISGSGTAGVAAVNPFVSEFPSGQSMSNWPMNPNTSMTVASDQLVIPYRIMALDHNVSWLAQFQGQGFQDIAGLASLTLLQSMMMAEELALISAQDTALTAPTIASVTARTAAAGETGASGNINIYVKATALNMFGQTAGGAAVSAALTSGQVADVIITDVTAAQGYNLFVSSGTGADPGDASRWKAGTTGWNHFSVTFPLPTSAAGAIPSSDSGTGTGSGAKRYDGLISILAGTTSALATYDPSSLGLNTGYTYRHNGGSSGTGAFGINDVQTALLGMWTSNKARPQEMWLNAVDRKGLSDSILSAGAQTAAYRIVESPDGAGQLKASAVVTAIWNEATGDEVAFTMHPYLMQGNSLIMSYTLPFPYSEVPNVAEVVTVQDYLSIAWPVIDARYRYSIYLYGALALYAPQYCGLIQGIPKQAASKPWL